MASGGLCGGAIVAWLASQTIFIFLLLVLYRLPADESDSAG